MMGLAWVLLRPAAADPGAKPAFGEREALSSCRGWVPGRLPASAHEVSFTKESAAPSTGEGWSVTGRVGWRDDGERVRDTGFTCFVAVKDGVALDGVITIGSQ
jgi:hypothetical protein